MRGKLEAEKLSGIFKALSNEHRVRILKTLGSKKLCCLPYGKVEFKKLPPRRLKGKDLCCVGDVCSALEISPSTISHHLKELKNARLVLLRKRGKFVYCYLNKKTLNEVREFLRVI